MMGEGGNDDEMLLLLLLLLGLLVSGSCLSAFQQSICNILNHTVHESYGMAQAMVELASLVLIRGQGSLGDAFMCAINPRTQQ